MIFTVVALSHQDFEQSHWHCKILEQERCRLPWGLNSTSREAAAAIPVPLQSLKEVLK